MLYGVTFTSFVNTFLSLFCNNFWFILNGNYTYSFHLFSVLFLHWTHWSIHVLFPRRGRSSCITQSKFYLFTGKKVDWSKNASPIFVCVGRWRTCTMHSWKRQGVECIFWSQVPFHQTTRFLHVSSWSVVRNILGLLGAVPRDSTQHMHFHWEILHREDNYCIGSSEATWGKSYRTTGWQQSCGG